MKKASPILLLICFGPLMGFAGAGCKTVDMTLDPGYVNSKDSLQGNMGWCASYSLAHLMSQKLGQPVSALDLALRGEYYATGELKHPNGVKVSGKTMEGQRVILAKEPWACPIEQYRNVSPFQNEETLEREKKNFEMLSCQPDSHQSLFFANITQLTDIQDAVRTSRDSVEYMKKLNEKNCKTRVPFPFKFETKSHPSGWDQLERHEQTARYVRGEINKGKMVSFDFDPTFFFNHDMSLREKLRLQVVGGHRATLVGMTERGGECFYRIRDSTYADPENCKEAGNSKVKCLSKFTYEVRESDLMKALKNTMVVAD